MTRPSDPLADLNKLADDIGAKPLSLPYPPSANKLWRSVPGKGVLKSGHYRAWLAEGLQVLKLQRAHAVKGHYRLTISAVRPDRRARDLDNLAKPVSDLLKAAGVIEDDHLAQSILMHWSTSEPVKGGSVTVLVEAAA